MTRTDRQKAVEIDQLARDFAEWMVKKSYAEIPSDGNILDRLDNTRYMADEYITEFAKFRKKVRRILGSGADMFQAGAAFMSLVLGYEQSIRMAQEEKGAKARDSPLDKAAAQYETKTGHVLDRCSTECDNEFCNICQGGLYICTVCKKAEVDLADKCPGELLRDSKEDQ